MHTIWMVTTALALTTFSAAAGALPNYPLMPIRKRCTANDSCWPSAKTWSAFNASVDGRLIASHPSAAVCHDPSYDPGLCETARANWTSSPWRTDQVGAFSALVWELGDEQCYLDTPRSKPCQQGLVAPLSVNVSTIEDIQKALSFADKHELYLTIKNTGHDHLGRSSGDGSLAIWTHHMKGRQWHDSFVPLHAPLNTAGQPAVTVQAGEQWIDIYRDASAHSVIVAGGGARTVGAAGGFILGGGISPFSHFYGLAVDNLLQMTIVKPTGEHVTLNEYTDPEYFWAVRGGAGSSWGVVTSVTYKTHPLPEHIQVAVVQANMSTAEAYRKVYIQALKSLPALTAEGYTGYGDTAPSETVEFIFLQPNGTSEALERGFKGFEALMALNGSEGISVLVANFTLPSWDAYVDYFLRDPNIATNIQDGSRLMSRDVLESKAEELVDLALEYPEAAAGHNFIGAVDNSQRDHTAVHPAWRESVTLMSYGIDWAYNATKGEKRRKREVLVEISKRLEKIVGREGGTYVNEANPYEPRWEEVFWGSKNYQRLLKVKRRIDPKGLMTCNRCVGGEVVYGI